MVDNDVPLWIKVAIAFAWASFAGLIAYLQQFINPNERHLYDHFTLIIKGVTAGFAGVLTYFLLARHVQDQLYVAFLLGIAGWGGSETIRFLQELFHDAMRRLANSRDRNGGPTNQA